MESNPFGILTDDMVHADCLEAWELCGQKSFWESEDRVKGVGKVLMYFLSSYHGKWENQVQMTLDNYAWRLKYITLHPPRITA